MTSDEVLAAAEARLGARTRVHLPPVAAELARMADAARFSAAPVPDDEARRAWARYDDLVAALPRRDRSRPWLR